MLSAHWRTFQSSSCATCRLRSIIRGLQAARSRTSFVDAADLRSFGTNLDNRTRRLSSAALSRCLPSTTIRRSSSSKRFSRSQEVELIESLYTSGHISQSEWRSSVLSQAGIKDDDTGVEERVVRLREWYGTNSLPGALLDDQESKVHERLFGETRSLQVDQEEEGEGVLEHIERGTGVLKEGRDGLEEIEFDEEEVPEDAELEESDDGHMAEEDSLYGQSQDKRQGEKRLGKWNRGDKRLAEDIQAAVSTDAAARYRPVAEAEVQAIEVQDEAEDGTQEDGYQRTHPLTAANRFATHPSTIEMPKMPFVDPVTTMLANVSNVHLSEAAHRVFGGAGLPYSTSTPQRGKLMQQKPIGLDAYQSSMSEMDGNLFISTLIPGMYSSTLSVLAETRKRLGTEWAEKLVRKAEAGTLRILDAGGAGSGVLAVREVIRAEWERMHADTGNDGDSSLALAEADGKVGGVQISAPLGHATVLASSDVLRRRASNLLEDTTFVPRLPDYLHAEVGAQGKFDIVVAPHSLWALREDYRRKAHVQNLWSLLSTDGGVLVLLEKGVPRGFEIIAGARDLLLETRISSPGSEYRLTNIDEKVVKNGSFTPGAKFESVVWNDAVDVEEEVATDGNPDLSTKEKETGMIIAPCTNHTGCPMYAQKGIVKGRREICAFSQRYHRPAFLQHIFGTKGRNHEDVEFSYLAVMRGKDLRAPQEDLNELGTSSGNAGPIQQGQEATDIAFAGYESASVPGVAAPHSLSLPRAIMPPLKRQGHVIIDLCTPSGTLERWTVPRSFSKQAFRDARKAQWGDLWALGAKTRVMRNVRAKPRDLGDLDAKVVKRDMKRRMKVETQRVADVGADEYGRVRSGEKLRGIRDKRDKKGTGNGRRRNGGRGVVEEID